LKYLGEVKAWGRLVVAAGAILLALALPAGAQAATRAHPRHVEIRPATSHGFVELGEHDGYEFAISLAEPDYAILYAASFDQETQSGASTEYGAHFTGSLPGGRVRATFGGVGSISLRFRPSGRSRSHSIKKNCQGQRPREERGHFVGTIRLRGENDYFRLSVARANGYLDRSFRLRCRVRHQAPVPPPTSLPEAVIPGFGFVYGSGGGSVALLEAGTREGDRGVELRAAHMQGARPGAEVQAIAVEYQGKMPVGRSAWASESPAGTLLTSLPGEHPRTATLRPVAPFSGEGSFVATAPTAHSWTGDLAVQFPGLLEPLAGPAFYSTLCVSSPLRDRYGCDFVPPDWQFAE
jgi:hypothetical protein